jgi:hypothetical protein
MLLRQLCVRWRRRRLVSPLALGAAVLISATAPAPSQAAKMFVVLADPGGLPASGPVLRYDVDGTTSVPQQDATLTDPSFDLPCCLAFSPSGELLVSNRSFDGASFFGGSITRFRDPEGTPSTSGVITSQFFSQPFWGAFRQGELFVPQRGFNNLFVLRFRLDAAGNASFNGSIDAGLDLAAPRSAAFSRSGELFVSQCCESRSINRYRFDAAGNAIANGVITGGGLDNPHEIAFSPTGELFVANAFGDSVSRFTFDGAGNAVPHGQITAPTLHGPIGLGFSPWGELFVANVYEPGGVSRFTFDGSGTAIPNGFVSTPNTVLDVAFPPTPANRPPNCARVTLSPKVLWPPNHRFVVVTATGASDPDPGDAVTLRIDRITQDEPVNGRADGNTAPDAVLATPPADHARVRAERSGAGDGRVYKLHYAASDTHGGHCQGSATVTVPISPGQPALSPPYNSLEP